MTEFERMLQLLGTSWLMRQQIVPCLVGPPGIGKTAAVEEHARRHGCGKVVKIVASRCVPSETVGMTMPNHDNRSMDIYNSMQLSSLNDGDILFLDELLEADQFVLSTLLTVIESREMADGTPLPDIQIVAATNDTISPEQLKGNIRQRFMFMRFDLDRKQVKQYILDKTGMIMPDSVLARLNTNGNDYNFLTPRSLTKLCLWMDAAPENEVRNVQAVINSIWQSTIGTAIAEARRQRDAKLLSPEQQTRKAIKDMITNGVIKDVEEEKFNDCTFSELLEILQALPEWTNIAQVLDSLEMVEAEEAEVDIDF